MADTTSTIKARFQGETKDLERAGRKAKGVLSEVEKAGGKTHKSFASLSTGAGAMRVGVSKAFGGLASGIPIAGAAVVGMGLLAKSVVDNAVQLDTLNRRAKLVYGTALPEMSKWAVTAGRRAGETSREVLGLTAGLETMFKKSGFAASAARDMSKRMFEVSAAVAEASGGQIDAAGAADVLAAAFRGEYDSAQTLGIQISDAQVKAEALKETHKKSADQLTDLEKNQAAYKLILEGTTQQQKLYADGQDGLAANLKKLKAGFGEARDAVLIALVPALTKLSGWVADHTDAIVDFPFQLAGGFVDAGVTIAFGVADVLDSFGDAAIGMGRWVRDSLAGFLKVGEGSTTLSKIMGVAISGPAQAAMDKLSGMAADAGQAMVDTGTKTKGMADEIRKRVPPAAETAKAKIEDVRDAALNIPKKTLTQITADEKDAKAKVADIRTKLRDPELTKTRKAKLQADLKKWQDQLKQIQRDKDLIAKAVYVPTAVTAGNRSVRVKELKDKAGRITEVHFSNGVVMKAAGGAVYGPGSETSDSVPARLSRNEHVWTAAEVRGAGGHQSVAQIRKLAAAGKLPGFATGGYLDRSFRPSLTTGAGHLRDSAMASILASVAKRNTAGDTGLGGGSVMGWARQMAALHTAFPGLALISGFRPGAITATGNRSYHASGRAVDVPPRMDVFEWIRSHYGARTKELIFSPAGNRQLWNGKPHWYNEPTRGDHWDHVHWAMRRGGVIREPVFGVGLKTGATYSLGESGPETVTPGVGGSAGFDVHVHLDDTRLRDLIRVEIRAKSGQDAQRLRARSGVR